MINYPLQIKILIRRLLPVYLIYFICRLAFFIANYSNFSGHGYTQVIMAFVYGLRFDTFSILCGNALFILLSILPFKFVWNKGYQKALKLIFLLFNFIFLLANCIDIGYFAYSKKRSGADLFHQVGGQTDLGLLLPQYISDFWWIVLFLIGMLYLLNRTYSTSHTTSEKSTQEPGGSVLMKITLFILCSGLTVLGIRGGFQRIPIDIVDAGLNTEPGLSPLVLNTPFTIIKSIDKKGLNEVQLIDENKLAAIYTPIHHFKDLQFNQPNIVVVILESFAKEYTSLGHTVSYTPFLDSLMQHSLVFTNAFSNGAKSIEGIPAILSSMPSLMENPFINSPYSNNFQTSFANLLAPEGYFSAFFHGGINGTMNFDAYAKLSGYKEYHGKNEYNNDKDFDGFWGIYDEPFLQYAVNKMSMFKQPFHSAIFTISSHHPYRLPDQYKNRFPKGHLENSESIGYADYALKKFFESAAKTEWYKNSLFVITADHSSISEHPYFSNLVGQKTIPIMFFKPDNSLARHCDSSFSQMDILPTAMYIAGYNKPFFAFGNPIQKRKNNQCYYYQDGTNYVVCDTILCCYHDTELYSVTDLKRDSLLTINLFGKLKELEDTQVQYFHAFRQVYNKTLIRNTGNLNSIKK